MAFKEFKIISSTVPLTAGSSEDAHKRTSPLTASTLYQDPPSPNRQAEAGQVFSFKTGADEGGAVPVEGGEVGLGGACEKVVRAVEALEDVVEEG